MDNGTAKAVKKAGKNNEYAITITLKHIQSKTPFGMFKETAPAITRLLKASCKFVLCPEWRHTSGDIHYHGIIEIIDLVKWFKQTLPSLKTCGFLLLKKIDDMDKWNEYINKESYVAKEIIPLSLPITKQVVLCKSKKDLLAYKDKSGNIKDTYEIIKTFREDECKAEFEDLPFIDIELENI